MPSTSKAQHNLMEGVAHSPAFAQKVGIPQSVGQKFSAADKMRRFAQTMRKHAASLPASPTAPVAPQPPVDDDAE